MNIKYFFFLILIYTKCLLLIGQEFKKNNNNKFLLFESDIPGLKIFNSEAVELPKLHYKTKSKDFFYIYVNNAEAVKYTIEPLFTKNVFVTNGLTNGKNCQIKYLDKGNSFHRNDFYINYTNSEVFKKEHKKLNIRILETEFNLKADQKIGLKNGLTIKFLGDKQLYDPVFGSKTSINNNIAEFLDLSPYKPKVFKKDLKTVESAKFYLSVQATINNFSFEFFKDEYPSRNYDPSKVGGERDLGTGLLQIDWKFISPNGDFKFVKSTNVIASFKEHDANELFKLLLNESVLSLVNDTSLYNTIKYDNELLEKLTKIKTIEVEKVESLLFTDTKSIISRCREGVVTIFDLDEKSFGSGFVISSEGYIVTNYHVIEDNKDIKVQFFGDTTKFNGSIKDVNEDLDLALIKVDSKKNLTSLRLVDSETVDIGENVFAIGTPGDKKLSQSVSKGIISGKREIDDKNYFQTDVSINFGNSGGPLINEKGEVIGIVLMKMVGRGVEGLSFVIPSSEVSKAFNIRYK